jgi:PTH1 family peptidyl-tRNA hydrolase
MERGITSYRNAKLEIELYMELAGIVAGLGNPGREYEGTRHNFGFLVLDALVDACREFGTVSTVSCRNDPYALERCRMSTPPFAGMTWLLAKPLAFMNRSGEAIQRISAYYRIPAQQILVLHDELDLPIGRMRMKQGGGNAGHNGLKSIQQHLGTPEFHRLRLGIGKSPHGDASSHVLGRFSELETSLAVSVMRAAVQGVLLFMRRDSAAAQRFCNGYAPPS